MPDKSGQFLFPPIYTFSNPKERERDKILFTFGFRSLVHPIIKSGKCPMSNSTNVEDAIVQSRKEKYSTNNH
jgi:hypothetical protein